MWDRVPYVENGATHDKDRVSTSSDTSSIAPGNPHFGMAFDDVPAPSLDGTELQYLLMYDMQPVHMSMSLGILRMAVQAIFGYVKDYGIISCVCTLTQDHEVVGMRRHPDESDDQVILCGYGHAAAKSKRKQHGVCRHNITPMEVMVVERLDEDSRTKESIYVTGDTELRTYVGMRLEALPECSICVLFLKNHATKSQIETTTKVLQTIVHELNSSLMVSNSQYQAKLEMQAAKAASLRVQNALLYVSHEIRNQLVPWSLLMEDYPEGEDKEMMATTLSTVNNILSRILSMGKAMHGGKERVLNFFPLERMLKAVDAYATKLIETKFKGRDESKRTVEYKRTLFPDTDIEVLADEHNMKQCIMNLISNANKFTNHGSITLEGEVVIEMGSRLILTLCVRDTGKGVPKEKLATILQPYGQADTSSVAQKGTGLGLHLCQHMVETTYKGRMTFESEEGKGSVVTTMFPLTYKRTTGRDAQLQAWSQA